ncbi:GNAT family N-acetyltransferase [Paenibacillus sp.]|uniref:GNAT family N-acetyltransferase n=1 Tax=Paenibacillus sp. TaxID=58172 RepID=UPI002D3A522E|nr:GNAT family N-acetyltransferase [Paenibacillus sp.]HZG57989.1 GNAT family N-acetyltransferase [Paenibacillus sp.]
MGLHFDTLTAWDEDAWRGAAPIFDEAFAPQGRKTHKMVRKIVDTSAGLLHLASADGVPVAMAVTGFLPELGALLIDYVAVREAHRSRGVGRRMIGYLEEEALRRGLRGLVIEIEAEANAANEGRERFWTSLGFVRTDYVHKYRWVPETYRALYKELTRDAGLPRDGETLFDAITRFHGKIWRDA